MLLYTPEGVDKKIVDAKVRKIMHAFEDAGLVESFRKINEEGTNTVWTVH